MTTGTVMGVHDRLYIGGEWVRPAGDETMAVLNPATEEEIACIPAGTVDDVDRAVAAARAAFDGWAATPPQERGALLAAVADGLSERADELAVTIATELGMPLPLSRLIQ